MHQPETHEKDTARLWQSDRSDYPVRWGGLRVVEGNSGYGLPSLFMPNNRVSTALVAMADSSLESAVINISLKELFMSTNESSTLTKVIAAVRAEVQASGAAEGRKDFRIVVIDAGWVLVGEYSLDEKRRMVVLENSSCPQRWGTTKGIGELALCGPTNESIIHPTGHAEIPEGKVLFTLRVVPEAAAKWPC